METHSFKKEITIRNRTIIEEMQSPYIIAEMACAHDGHVDKAKILVDSAVNAGADAIQFEIFEPDANIVPQSEVYTLLKDTLYFTKAQWTEVYDYAKQFDIAISTFAYDFPSLELGLELGTDLIKLNSSDLSNPDMILGCAESGLPFTIGTGSSTDQEMAKTLALSLKHGGDKVIMIHGLQNFPTDFRNAHVRRMNILRDSFDCLVGYADHTDGDNPLSHIIDLIAVGMGASVIEKHITVDRKEKGIDYQAALEPAEFKEYVELMKLGYTAMGPSRVIPLKENDFSYRRFQKKSIVAVKDIRANEVLSRENTAFLRNPATPGISPMDHEQVMGKKVKNTIKKFDQVQYENLTEE